MTTTPIPALASAFTNASASPFQQAQSDFQSLRSALQKGDLSTARSAIQTFLQDVQTLQGASTRPPLLQAAQGDNFLALQKALESGDLEGAKQAFKGVQQDLQAARQAAVTQRPHHHHHHAGKTNDADADDQLQALLDAAAADPANQPVGSTLDILA